MKRTALFLLLVLAAFAHPRQTFASHAAGGEIIYEWISDSTYRFYFTLYRDCSGILEADTARICFNNPCNTNTNFTILLNKASGQNGTTQQGCAKYKNNCDSAASTLRGFRKWVYTGVATMPARCSAWRISGWVGDRNTNNNIGVGTSFYTETMMNNTGSYQGNSSPYYTAGPVPEVCINQPCAYSCGPVDPDGDSLASELIMPRYSNGCSSTPVNCQLLYNYSVPYNPFSTTGSSFWVSSLTGAINFTPNLLGASSITLRTKEYRNGVLIGYVDREMQVQVVNCNGTAPTFNVVTPQPIEVCVGQQMNFCWYVKSPTATTELVVSDNHTVTYPGATVSYQNQGTDSVYGCLSWVPSLKEGGFFHHLGIVVKDTSCDLPGIVKTYYYDISALVAKPANAGKDTAICPGGSVTLSVSGQGYPVLWSVIYGTPNSLSCTGCQFPTLTPTVTTAYELILTGGTACLNSKDTITIYMAPIIKPSVAITAAPDTNVLPGTTVTFTAIPTSCINPTYQWRRNGNNLSGATLATFSSANLVNNDVITVMMHCTDTCIIDTPSNKLKLHIGTDVKTIGLNSIAIHPNPNTGEFTITGYTEAKEISIEIVNITGQVVYRQDNVAIVNGQVDRKVNVSNISNGNYMLRIKTDSKVFAERLTIQR